MQPISPLAMNEVIGTPIAIPLTVTGAGHHGRDSLSHELESWHHITCTRKLQDADTLRLMSCIKSDKIDGSPAYLLDSRIERLKFDACSHPLPCP